MHSIDPIDILSLDPNLLVAITALIGGMLVVILLHLLLTVSRLRRESIETSVSLNILGGQISQLSQKVYEIQQQQQEASKDKEALQEQQLGKRTARTMWGDHGHKGNR